MKKTVCIIISICTVAVLTAFAAGAEEMSNYELMEQLKATQERLNQLKGEEAGCGHWPGRISLSGIIEVEAGYEKIDYGEAGVDSEDASDYSLATVELGVDANITEHVSGHVLFLYEDGEDILVDEGFILLDGFAGIPVYLKAGEMYLPFGNFESHMISDPLTLELAETRETAVEVGFDQNGLYGMVYAFNGDVDEDGEESHIDNFGATVGYATEQDAFTLDVGVGYINSILDSDGCTDAMDELREAAEEEDGFTFALADYVGGITVHAIAGMGPFTLIGEYVAAMEDPEFALSDVVPGSLAGLGLEDTYEIDKPAVWNMEAGYAFNWGGKESTVAIAYQGSENAEDIFPESRYIGSIGIGIFENTTLAFEYLHDTYENDDEADVVTAQLAIEF